MDETSSPQPDGPDASALGSADASAGESRDHSEGESTSDTAALVVAVTRTGGIAGIERVWTAEPREDEASVWADLIARCPWDDTARPDVRGADRFLWNIHARCGPDDREADLPDRALTGAWRDLVDAVREWGSANAPGAR